MSKILVLFSLLTFLSAPAWSQLIPAEGTEAAIKQAQEKCKEACLVLSPEEIAWLQAQIDAAMQKAYEAGLKGWASAS